MGKEQTSADERAVLADEGAKLYELAIARQGIPVDDPLWDEPAQAQARDLLTRVGLLLDDGARLHPVEPSMAQARVVNPLSQQGAELLAESAAWAQTFSEFAHAWRRSPIEASEAFTELRREAIDPYLDSLLSDAEREILTAQPQTGRDDLALRAASARDIAAIERGVRMRTLYQHSARRHAGTRGYVAAVSERGGEVRTLDEFFNRLIVVDRQVAVIPGHEGFAVAMAIREPSVVTYLVDMFERSWERGRPFSGAGPAAGRDIASEQRATAIRMLIEGHADGASAKRLGVSPRTYAGYISDLKNEYDVSTRFQLGYMMGRESEATGPPEE